MGGSSRRVSEIRGRYAGILFEEIGEVGQVFKSELKSDMLDRLVCIAQKPFSFHGDPFLDNLGRGLLIEKCKKIGQGFG